MKLHEGSEIGYDRLLLATGSRVRRFSGSVDPRVPLHYTDEPSLPASISDGSISRNAYLNEYVTGYRENSSSNNARLAFS